MSRRVVGRPGYELYTTSAAAVTLTGEVVASCRQAPAGGRGAARAAAKRGGVHSCPPAAGAAGSALPRDRRHGDRRRVRLRPPQGRGRIVYARFSSGGCSGTRTGCDAGRPFLFVLPSAGAYRRREAGQRDSAGDLLALHLSGGTTELLSMRGDDLTLLGGSLDLHAGQLVDRVGVALKLPFPAGPRLEELARRGQSAARLPVSMAEGDLMCHLSGRGDAAPAVDCRGRAAAGGYSRARCTTCWRARWRGWCWAACARPALPRRCWRAAWPPPRCSGSW